MAPHPLLLVATVGVWSGVVLSGCAHPPLRESPRRPEFAGLTAEACADPAPVRLPAAIPDREERADDPGFEAGSAVWHAEDGNGARVPEAARSGGWGLRVQAGDTPATLSVRLRLDKGAPTTVRAWVRATPVAAITVSARGEAPPRFQDDRPVAPPVEVARADVTPGSGWALATLPVDPAPMAAHHWLRIAVPAHATLDLDDVSALAAELPTPDPLPPTPAAPVHLTLLLHVEDIAGFRTDRAYFRRKAWLLEEVVRRVHARGGAVVVQPGLAFVEGAEVHAPGLLRSWTEGLGVTWSTHSHGPACRDEQGSLQPPLACVAHPSWTWGVTDEEVLGWLLPQRDALTRVTGRAPTDHNGNFDMARPGALATIGLSTLTAHKDPSTQRSEAARRTNPWRPAGGERGGDLSAFFAHDPDGAVVYLPGAGPERTRHWDRLAHAWGRDLAWRLAVADPSRVNTAYYVLHVDHFAPAEGSVADWLGYDAATDTLTPSAALLRDLEGLDGALDLLAGFAERGYLRWSTPVDMAGAFERWEAACRALADTPSR